MVCGAIKCELLANENVELVVSSFMNFAVFKAVDLKPTFSFHNIILSLHIYPHDISLPPVKIIYTIADKTCCLLFLVMRLGLFEFRLRAQTVLGF